MLQAASCCWVLWCGAKTTCADACRRSELCFCETSLSDVRSRCFSAQSRSNALLELLLLHGCSNLYLPVTIKLNSTISYIVPLLPLLWKTFFEPEQQATSQQNTGELQLKPNKDTSRIPAFVTKCSKCYKL